MKSNGTETHYLFCNIGWMEYYQGQTSVDRLMGGGAYVAKKGRGLEVCNFLLHNGKFYGYVRPSLERSQININRLGAKSGWDSISGITVIWTARHPEGGTVVVGWYKDATVHRHYQKLKNPSQNHTKNRIKSYRIETTKINANLFSVDERTFKIPRRKSGMGHANVWYADKPENKLLIKEIAKLVGGKHPARRISQSRRTDPDKKVKVEKGAIKKTMEHFEGIGYTVESVEKDNVGWDLEATAGKIKLRIEVKGLSGNAPSIELTPNEYKAFSAKKIDYRLCIVNAALINPELRVCRISEGSGKWIVEGKHDEKVNIKNIQSAFVKINI